VTHVFVNAFHPGAVDTGIWSANPLLAGDTLQAVAGWLQRNVMWSVRDGALTMLFLGMDAEALAKGSIRGKYLHPQCVHIRPHYAAANVTLQSAFWEFTQELIAK
jgi:hypothetical protein